MREIWTARRAAGGVLLSSMGNPERLPVYWDRLLLNASQVTNPLHRPPAGADGNPGVSGEEAGGHPSGTKTGSLDTDLPPQLELSMPVMFSAMSYGSISYNAHESLARAAQELGIYYNTGEGGLHEDFYRYGEQHHRAGGLRPVRRPSRTT